MCGRGGGHGNSLLSGGAQLRQIGRRWTNRGWRQQTVLSPWNDDLRGFWLSWGPKSNKQATQSQSVVSTRTCDAVTIAHSWVPYFSFFLKGKPKNGDEISSTSFCFCFALWLVGGAASPPPQRKLNFPSCDCVLPLCFALWENSINKTLSGGEGRPWCLVWSAFDPSPCSRPQNNSVDATEQCDFRKTWLPFVLISFSWIKCAQFARNYFVMHLNRGFMMFLQSQVNCLLCPFISLCFCSSSGKGQNAAPLCTPEARRAEIHDPTMTLLRTHIRSSGKSEGCSLVKHQQQHAAMKVNWKMLGFTHLLCASLAKDAAEAHVADL